MFIILEIQKSNSGSVDIVPPTKHESRNEAEQKYHQWLSAAAVSKVNVHSVVMLSDYGDRIKGETYIHGDEVTE